MKPINKKILDLIRQVQDLVFQKPNMMMYCQSDIYLVSIYSITENGKFSYRKNLYIDGSLQSESQVIKELEEIIKNLEEMK